MITTLPQSHPGAQAGITGLCRERGPQCHGADGAMGEAAPQHVHRWALAWPHTSWGSHCPPVPSLPTFLPPKHLGQDVRDIQRTNPALPVFIPVDCMVSGSSAMCQFPPPSHPPLPLGPTCPPARGRCPVTEGCAGMLGVPSPPHGAAQSLLHHWGWSQLLLKHSSLQLQHPHQQCWARSHPHPWFQGCARASQKPGCHGGNQGCSAAGDKDQVVAVLEAHLSPAAPSVLSRMNPDQHHIPDCSHLFTPTEYPLSPKSPAMSPQIPPSLHAVGEEAQEMSGFSSSRRPHSSPLDPSLSAEGLWGSRSGGNSLYASAETAPQPC